MTRTNSRGIEANTSLPWRPAMGTGGWGRCRCCPWVALATTMRQQSWCWWAGEDLNHPTSRLSSVRSGAELPARRHYSRLQAMGWVLQLFNGDRRIGKSLARHRAARHRAARSSTRAGGLVPFHVTIIAILGLAISLRLVIVASVYTCLHLTSSLQRQEAEPSTSSRCASAFRGLTQRLGFQSAQ